MGKFGNYFVQFRSVRSDLTGLPSWARTIFIAVALPGIALVALSIVAVVVSLVVLLLVTVPVYVLLRAVTGRGAKAESMQVSWPNETKHVDNRVVIPDAQVPDEV